MELINEFTVGAPIDRAWAVLTDIEGIAPCMPGAQLTEIDGDEFKGSVKVKVGPITAQYQGVATFAEKNDAEHRAVIDASGRDSRGAGNANATITAQLSSEGTGTRAVITTDLKITGKVAQFGRGVMADVSEKLLGQFVECLESKLEEETGDVPDEESATAVSSEAPPTPGPRHINLPEAKPVDLLDTAGAPLLKRAAPFLAVLVLLFLLRRRR
jgi:carbon monoxide dehydrogenase subunit G